MNQIPHNVSHITSDSREVRKGSLFVAVRGNAGDGHLFLEKAQTQGAVLAVGEIPKPEFIRIPYFQVPDSREFLAWAAAEFYGRPSHQLLCVGVTGTSGKTTTSYLIESILSSAGHRVGVIGTINFRFGGKTYPSTHTTPGPVQLQGLLAEMKQDGCTAVVMEVSSHALKQKRVDQMEFDGVVFTNLSPEHLDFHPDMEDYFNSKAKLFKCLVDFSLSQGKFPVCVVNSADLYGKRLIAELASLNRSQVDVRSFGQDQPLTANLNGIQGKYKNVSIHSCLTGDFNRQNISAAVELCLGLGCIPTQIQDGIINLKGVPGRLERVDNDRNIHVWVDYAHKPDALEKVIRSLREIQGNHKLITVFGCGGDRDRFKRPVMGKIAAQGSTHVIITSDNPRTENPLNIISEIVAGTQGYNNVTVEADRGMAIRKAILMAEPNDLVLIAGKGHEDYQIIGAEKIHFDDREVVKRAFYSISARNT